MAYSQGALQMIENFDKQGLLRRGGSILDIGAGQIGLDVTPERLAQFFNHFSVEPVSVARADWIGKVLEACGFKYNSIDLLLGHNPILMDLNVDDLPPQYSGKFDLVINIGTTEHTANQGQAFKVIHDALKVGGISSNAVPALGLINHGLVTYSPKFFIYLARANRYEIVDWRLVGDPNQYQFLSEIANFPGAKNLERVRHTSSNILFTIRKVIDGTFCIPTDSDHALATLHTKWESWREYVKQPSVVHRGDIPNTLREIEYASKDIRTALDRMEQEASHAATAAAAEAAAAEAEEDDKARETAAEQAQAKALEAASKATIAKETLAKVQKVASTVKKLSNEIELQMSPLAEATNIDGT